MKEILLQAFGTTEASVIFYLGAFLSLLGAVLAQRMYRAQSLPIFAGTTATLMLSAIFFLVCLFDVFAAYTRSPELTIFFLASFSIFWLMAVISTWPITAPPPPVTRKRFRAWMGGLAAALIAFLSLIMINEFMAAPAVFGDVVTQILLGTICGIFLVVVAIAVFRWWRSRNAIWAWLSLAAAANSSAALILYQPTFFPDGSLLVYACLAACPLLMILGLFADQARFVRLESELRRGLVESSFKFEEEARHLKTILSTSREMVVHLDRDEHITHCTPSFLTLIKTTENCLNKKLADVLPPEWYAELAPAAQDARRGRTFQADKLLGDGENKRLFQIYAAPLHDDKQRIAGVHLSLIDLAEHGRREVSLETQWQTASTDLQTFRRIVDLSTEAIYMTDAGRKIIYANEATERLTGFTRAELAGQTPLQFRAPETAASQQEEILRKLSQGRRYRGEVTNKRKDGTLFPSDLTVIPFQQNGDAAGGGRYIWIENDATERQTRLTELQQSKAQAKESAAAVVESRRYHESLLDALRDLVFVVDHRGQCTFMNATARQRLGYTAEKFEVSRLPNSITDLLRLDGSMKAEVPHEEAPIRARNGQVITCAWRAQQLFNAKGERNGIVAIGRDISELKEMQSTLASYRQQVDEKIRENTVELQRRVDHLTRLLQAGEGVRLHTDLNDIMQRLADSMAALGWQRVLVYLRNAGELQLTASAGFSRKQRGVLSSVERVSYDQVALYFDDRFRVSRSYFVDSDRIAKSAALPYFPNDVVLPAEKDWRPRDSVLVPIIHNDEIVGVFAVFSPQDGKRPTAQVVHDLEIIADDAAMAVANSRLLKSHRRKEHHAQVLADIAEAFQSTRTLDQIVAEMAEIASRAFDCKVILALRDDFRTPANTRWLVAESASSATTPRHVSDKKLSILSDELSAKKPVLIRKRRDELPAVFAADDKMAKAKMQNAEVGLLAVPLLGRGQKIGLLVHYDVNSKKEFSDADVQFAGDFAERVALTYENAQLFFETEKKAHELEHANQMVSDFLANTSHELRTPMQAILSMSDFLLRGLPGELNKEQQRQIAIIQTSGRSLLALINDILDLSKIEAGKMEAVIDDFILQELLREIAETVQPLCREKNLQLHVELAKNAPQKFTSDPIALRRVLTNLLGNAIKFTERGHIYLKTQPGKNNGLEITVRDTGIGIAPAHLKKIFEPFHQVENGSTRQHGGSGLGLAISQKLVGLLGGTIDVESAPGKGTTFSLSIPLAQKSSSAKATERPGQQEIKRKKKGFIDQTTARMKGKPRILVVEDNENTRYAMQFLLENEGYQVDFADGGEQALLAAQHHKPQLILLDIMMPGMDGYQVTRMLKAQKQLAHIPVIAVSARAMKGDRELALTAGCDDYLTKPFERKDILAVVERWLDNGRR